MLALLGLLGGSAGLRLLTSGSNSGSCEDLGGRGCLGERRRLDIGPVEVLVLGVPLGGSLLVRAAEFLVMLALHKDLE